MRARLRIALSACFVGLCASCLSSTPTAGAGDGDATSATSATARDDLAPLDVPSAETSASAEGQASPPPQGAQEAIAPNDAQTAPSAKPTFAEWSSARRLRTESRDCTLRLVREWAMIACSVGAVSDSPTPYARVISGDATNVTPSGWIPRPEKDDHYYYAESHVYAVLPLRRGDRRIFELGYAHDGAAMRLDPALVFVVSEVWLEGMRSPEISVTR